MLSKRDWLDAGLTLLAESGPRGLRLEVVCRAVGATRGSFYHHFADVGSYRRAVAAHVETEGTTQYVQRAEAVADQGPEAQIRMLHRAVVEDAMTGPEMLLERAFRAWATQDDEVAEIVRRIDEVRRRYVADLFARAGDPAAETHAAQAYLTLIGAHYVVPPLPAEEVGRLVGDIIAQVVDLDG